VLLCRYLRNFGRGWNWKRATSRWQ